MAFPTVEATNTSYETSAVTTHNISLPSGVSDGDLLIALLALDGTDADSTWPSSTWTEIKDLSSSNNRISVAYRHADGLEGSTVDVDTTTSRKSAHNTYRISGHKAATAPEISTGAEGASQNPDPDSLSPAGGSDDYLWIVMVGSDNELTVNSYPANYGNGFTANSSSGSFGATASTARREYTGSSEDPGTFTMSTSDDWAAVTIAVMPAAVSGKPWYTYAQQ